MIVEVCPQKIAKMIKNNPVIKNLLIVFQNILFNNIFWIIALIKAIPNTHIPIKNKNELKTFSKINLGRKK